MSDLEKRIEQLSPLQRAVYALQETQARLERLEAQRREPIALIGMACRFPGGVRGVDDFWKLMCDGGDAIREIPADRWDVDGYYDPDPQAPGKMNSRFGGFLDDVDRFDNHFFGISDEEARMLDPQHRLLLELTWEALEDAGIAPDSLRGSRTGVFLGISISEYSLLMCRNPHLLVPHFSTGTALSIAANRISFVFDWHGPSLTLDTACSSSLVALHLASQSIRNGECDLAVVGGANLILTPSGSIVLTKFGMSAPGGRIRAFDRAACGYVRSEGVGVLVLKPQSAADSDGDRPYALIRGSSVSQVGRANGLSAPVGAVQEVTLRSACDNAGIPPARIAYVETQGTGTLMGDAIEAKALGAVLSEGRNGRPPCAIGSVKTNIGHLEAASGIASTIKVALCLKHGQLPPSLHFASPNPMIPFEQLRLRVPTALESLPKDEHPTVAGVNAFGYGGSNAHVLLETVAGPARKNVPAATEATSAGSLRLLTISARTEPALRDLAAAYRDYLRSAGLESKWSDICATALHRREHHDCRLAVLAKSASDAAEQIGRWLDQDDDPDGRVLSGRRPFERLEVKAAVRAALQQMESCDAAGPAWARLYLAGGERELRERMAHGYTAVKLPHYPWQRKRAWTDEPNPYARAGQSVTEPAPPAPAAIGPRPDFNTPYVAPATGLEERIAAAWSRVLRVQPVGRHDNFFELGGQSLQAAVLIHELQQSIGVHLDLIALFELQTVHQLAAHLEELRDGMAPARLYTECPPDSQTDEARRSAASTGTVIPRIPRGQPLPLSYGQQRFWFLDRLAPGAPLFNTHLTIPLDGPFDRRLLHGALSQAIARHESLRTVFTDADGVPYQQILDSVPWDLPVVELAEVPSAERPERVRILAQEHAATSFRLDQPPLFRTTLLRMSDVEHVLLLTIHHIVTDGVSLAVLLRDVMEFYEAGRQGRAARLPELAVQYADFAVWQRAAMQGDALAQGLAHWRETLAGIQPLRLHCDRSRSSAAAPVPGTYRFPIPGELFQKLQAVCRRERVTPFFCTLAAFQVLLSRYSGQTDLVVGTPVAGRGRSELADVVGFFVNTLALRIDLSGPVDFAEVLHRVRASYLNAMAHQDVPFDQLAKAIEPDREPHRHPVFQVMFNYLQQVDSDGGPRSGGLTIGRIPTEQPPHGGDLDLVLVLAETDDGLDANLGFNAALFDQQTVERIGGHFLRLLQQIVTQTDRPISELDVLEPAERQQLLVQWNQTQADFPADRCLHQLVEAQVARTCDQVALVAGTQELTFGDMNRQANRLAHLLQQRGVRRDQLVGLCLPRCPEAIIGMLGILKAGGAFLPIDPALPAERVAAMCEDGGVELAVSSPSFAGRLPVAVRWVPLDESAGLTDENPVCTATPRDLAYAIFTSGSTGRPKGVLIEHRSVVNIVSGFIRSYGVGGGDRVLQNTSLSFDVSINEIFPALSSGATIVFSDDESQTDARLLANLIRDRDITIAGATPTVLSHVNRECTATSPLRLVLSGGEALSYHHVDRLLESAIVTNGYGPTEACIAATCYPLRQGGAEARIPIGRPLDNYRVYIVDPHLNPLPVGCAGELCIAGVGLARGYANDPELTAAKFVACPFEPGGRMYRTGDLARWLPDGNIAFLGRLDRQVKLRGLRIEPGEIESALAAIDVVRTAAVVHHQPETGTARLVAYVVLDPAAATEDCTEADWPQRLLERLDATLPGYLVPRSLQVLQEMPLTANGKIDYHRLPAPLVASTRRRAPEAPRTSVEKHLYETWKELLDLREFCIHDSFFELGGHSLLATQLIARVNQRFQTDLALRVLFESPTIEKLARHIDSTLRCGAADSPPIDPIQDRSRDFPLSGAQELLWTVHQLSEGGAPYGVGGIVRLRGRLERDALEEAVNFVIRRHEILRTVYPEVNGEPVQRVLPFEPLRLTVTDISHQQPDQREAAARQIARGALTRRMDLADPSLVQLHLLRIDRDHHWLVVSGHHIAFDAWSSTVLQREIGIAYAAFSQGQRPPLPRLPVQYADYAVWQRARLDGAHGERCLAYWRQKLEGVPALRWPAWPKRRQSESRVAAGEITLSAAQSETLRRFCRERDLSPFMLMLTVFELVLFRYSGQSDFAVGVPLAGRVRPEIVDLIGCFMNPAVFRGDVSGNPTFDTMLQRTRQTTLEAFEHEEMPFGRLVQELNPQRTDGRQPLFQVLFNYSHAFLETSSFGGLLAEPIELAETDPKLELAMTVAETQGQFRVDLAGDATLFDVPIVREMLQRFQQILDRGLRAPHLQVSELPKLSDAEHCQSVSAENGAQVDLAALRCVHHSFERIAARTPDAIAVACEDRRLTYAQLNTRANQLARYLCEQGVGCEDLVGVLLDRSVDVPAAALAVWKAGAVLVLLDPDYPPQRISLVLEDCQPRVLLTNERILPCLDYSGQRVVLERDQAAIERQSRDDPPSRAGLENAAYVIYTSGSTGRPKGVINLHRGLANVMAGDSALFRLTPECRCLSRGELGFDMLDDLLRPLLAGGRLVLAGSEEYRDPAALVRLIRREQVTGAAFVPAMLQAIVAEDGFEDCTSLRQVISGGDVLAPELVRQFRNRNHAQLVNIYGPAETSIWCTFWICDAKNLGGRVPIGRPIPNAVIYILDDGGNPAPIGVEGELHVGGAGVGRGYVNRDELTAARFVADPFSDDPRARMYRTGDRGRWLPDGNIEFLGRRDHQVKIRGVRIELGEIESILKEYPGVRDAAVDVRVLPDGEKALAAYLVAVPGHRLDLESLRSLLRRRLPSVMQPASYRIIERMPLSDNGKVDRRQLPEPNWTRRVSVCSDARPLTPTETRVAAIWTELLGLETVGMDQSFFELGGHSLLAVKAMTRIRAEFGAGLPLATIFSAPTIAQLACEIDHRGRGSRTVAGGNAGPEAGETAYSAAGSPLVRIGRGDRTPLFVVHGLGGYVTNLVPLGRALSDSYDVYALEGRGPFDDSPPHDNLPEMAAPYVAAVRDRQPRGPYHLAGWSMGGTVAWEMCRQLLEQGEAISRLVLIDAYPLWNHRGEVRTGFVAARLLDQLGSAFADIRSLPKRKRWPAIVDRAGEYQGVGAASIRRLIRTCEAHLSAGAAYVPGRLDVDVVAFWAKQGWGKTLVSAWRKRARSYQAHHVPGDHYSMLEPSHVAALTTAWRRHVPAPADRSRKAG